jgi:hypothetical protein
MRLFRIAIAFVLGASLCHVVVYLAGFLAAIGIPRAYFAWFVLRRNGLRRETQRA